MVALLFVGGATLLSSCKEEKKQEEGSLDALMTEQSENLTIVVTENGRKSYRFTTPLLEGYMLGRDPYREFRKGISITTFQDDSMQTVNATLEANYAIYYENRKLWEAKGNVRVNKYDGTKLYTQQLFWDSTTKHIYSNVDTKVVTESDTHFCEGFDSDEDFVELKFRRWKGKMLMEEDMLSPKDSLADDSTPSTEGVAPEGASDLKERKEKKEESAQEVKPAEKLKASNAPLQGGSRFPSESPNERPRPRIVSKPKAGSMGGAVGNTAPLEKQSLRTTALEKAKPDGAPMQLNSGLSAPANLKTEDK